MPRHAQPLALTVPEEEQLTARVRDRRSTQQMVLRARIVLLSAQHWENQEIAAELATSPHTVGCGGGVLPASAWLGWRMPRVPRVRCRWLPPR